MPSFFPFSNIANRKSWLTSNAVIGTVLAIWAFGWWGIALACVGLGALYLIRSLLEKVWRTPEDVAKENYKSAMELYYRKVHDYDAHMDEIERRGRSNDT